MDTSHYSILEKFLRYSQHPQIRVDFYKDRYDIINPSIVVKRSNHVASATMRQYAQILVFYGLIDFDIIKNNRCKNWKEVLDLMVDGEFDLPFYSMSCDRYLRENVEYISMNIKKILNSNIEFVKETVIKILSTMEIFLNYKNWSSVSVFVEDDFDRYINSYPWKINLSNKSNGKYKSEYTNWKDMFSFSEKLLAELLS